MAPTQHKKKQRSSRIAFLLLTVFFLVLMAVGSWLLWQTFSSIASVEGVSTIYQVEGLDPSAKVGSLTSDFVAKSGQAIDTFTYGISVTPTFSATGKGKILFESCRTNQYLAVLELTKSGEDQLLYQSQYIAPNQYIEELKFSVVPTVGTYDMVAFINIIDPKSLQVIDILEQPITAIVKS